MIYAYQTLNDREEAMDMVQEAFTRFFKEEKVRNQGLFHRTTRNLYQSLEKTWAPEYNW